MVKINLLGVSMAEVCNFFPTSEGLCDVAWIFSWTLALRYRENRSDRWAKNILLSLCLVLFVLLSVSLLFPEIDMIHQLLLLLLIIVAPAITKDFRTLRMSKVSDVKYQCAASGCSPSTIVTASSLINCQIACISESNCRTITFDESTHQCELFVDTPNQRGNLLVEAGVLTMIAIADQTVSTCK